MYSYESIQMISCPREGLTERIVKKVRTSRVININTHAHTHTENDQVLGAERQKF